MSAEPLRRLRTLLASLWARLPLRHSAWDRLIGGGGGT